MTAPERRGLAELAAAEGVPVPCVGNLPLDMGDPGLVWFVEEGAVDLFLIERSDGAEQSAPQHLLRAASGRLLPGIAPQTEPTTLALVAKGRPGTVLRRLPAERLAAVREVELAEHVDMWLAEISAMLVQDVANSPQADMLLEAGEDATADEGTVSVRRGVAWVSPPEGTGLFLGLIDPAGEAPDDGRARGAIPLTPATWLTLIGTVQLSARSSAELARDGLLLAALAHFHVVAFSVERLNRSLAIVDQANLERARAANRRTDEDGARRRLFNLYGLSRDAGAASEDSALIDALRIIGGHAGIEFRSPGPAAPADLDARLGNILDASGVRGRRVRLAADDRWWIGNSGAMLAFREEDGRPVALLPGVLGRYREVDPAGQRSGRVTAERARSLRAEAWLFYPPLPPTGAGRRDLLRLATGRGLAIDLARVVAAGLLGGLAMLLPAVVLGFVADDVIPRGEVNLLYMAAATLAAAAVLVALLQVLQGMALMRLEGRAASRIEAAFWDRLLRLPPSFLRRYPAGDLAMRGMTFQQLRDSVREVIASAVLSIVFLLPAFLLIFFYDAALGAATAGFGLLSLFATVLIGVRQVSPHARVIRAVNGLTGRLFQLINGISALRVEGAEASAFAVWARDYRRQKLGELERDAVTEHLQAFSAALPFLAGAALFLMIALMGYDTIGVGGFLVIFTVFMVFQTAVSRLGASFGALAAIMPAIDLIRPFVTAETETSAEGDAVDSLGGEVLFDRVSFRYDPDGPLILDDVSIRARPGEFVAIVGESGSGKSTLFRLALGLAAPSSGAVYYDGRDLGRLNVKQVRRRIGVVPQDVQLHPEDIWDNIVGDIEGVTEDDAWRAARLAGIDEEISAMPMGMMTNVGASASVISGGESQRIVIAHALLGNPRILLLDEATNWLDNDSQSTVMRSLSRLASTRIVIAHRLSTLREADRIYVMQAGRVVQEGSFERLAAADGVFQDLIRRQTA